MYSLKAHNSFGFDVNCSQFIEFSSEEELLRLLPCLRKAQPSLLIIGGGNNLLFCHDYQGTVAHSLIRGIKVTECGRDVMLTCGSGEQMDSVIEYAVEHGYYGAENLSLIPGDVGASAVQNIGAYGAEAKDIIHEVRAIEIGTGEVKTFSNADCHFAYRSSRFKHEWAGRYIITAVTYRLSTTFTPRLDYGNIRAKLNQSGIENPTAQQLRTIICDIRREKLPDPAIMGNAGSFFMNPVVSQSAFEQLLSCYPSMPHYPASEGMTKIPAGWLIEQSGWKGRALGRAAVHDKQALVIVNLGGATPDDVIRLCHAVQNDVEQQFGITLKPEVIMIK